MINRAEVLLEEAIEPPTLTGRYTLTGGFWYSWYDYTEATRTDIGHAVPLAEAWDSLQAVRHPQHRRDQVERWFGVLTDKLICRGVHTSVQALEDDIAAWIDTWNENPRPFTWTKTADEILNSLADYLSKVETDNQRTEN